ncbi:MAG: Rpn family recombination-promoting nuclease/putative transposase [Treponema sp.]|nr:Rpn family recombination-promoting nuclease/putative transposase [Treponema sp.]
MDSNVNRRHKSSVFSTLFSNPEVLREVYSAIEGIDIPPDAIIDINTLSDAIYMNQINDISFTINDRIVVLIEHQSTINNNVPVRLLMYIGRVYEKILEQDNLYQRKLVKIPTPEFIVLYNGKEEYPDYNQLKLSAAFKDIEGLKLINGSGLPLELVVHVYNINHGCNPQILAKSKTLDSYSIFISMIWEYNKELSLDESMRAAIKYCIEKGILGDFLKKHSSEVINMLFEEISVERLGAIRYKEGREDGIEKGREEVFELLSHRLSKDEVEEMKNLLMQTTGSSMNT